MPPKKKKTSKKRPLKKRVVTKKKPARKLAKKQAKKSITRKPALKAKKGKVAAAKGPRKKVLPPVQGTIAAEVTHYFPHVNAAVLKVKSPLKVGDNIRIKGHTTDFKETIASMQINHVPINEAKNGDEIGLLVSSRVRIGDIVYKI